MRLASLAAALLLLLAMPVLGQGVVLTVTPTDAAFGQPIKVGVYNGSGKPIYYGGNYNVHDGGGAPVLTAPGGSPWVTLAPGKHRWSGWGQKDNSWQQVAPGYYTISVGYTPLSTLVSRTLRQPIIIRDAKISWSGWQNRGSTVYFNLDAPRAKGLAYRTLLSFDNAYGVDFPGGRRLQLVPDALFFLSATNHTTAFKKFAGTVDSKGKASAWIDIPNNPLLRGLKYHAAFVMFSQYSPGGIHSVTNSLDLQIL